MIILTEERFRINGRTKYKAFCNICGTEFLIEKTGYYNLKNKESCAKTCSYHINKYICTNYGRDVDECFRMRYNSMKQRCEDENASNYKWYGGKGVKFKYVSFGDFFNKEFERFIAGYNEFKNNVSPERIDIDGDYCPENLIWINFSDQCLNTSIVNKSCIGISPSGEKYYCSNLTKFAEEHGLTRQHIGKCLNGKLKQHKKWKFYYL